MNRGNNRTQDTAAPAAGGGGTARPPALKDLRVLIAEDSFHIAMVIETVLRTEGAVVLGPAATLDEAYRLIDGQSLDLAVVDLKLGDADALPLVRQLAAAGTRVVISTGHDLPADLKTNLGDMIVLMKPYTSDQLLGAIGAGG